MIYRRWFFTFCMVTTPRGRGDSVVEAVDKTRNLGDELGSRLSLGDVQRAGPFLVHVQSSSEVGEEAVHAYHVAPVGVLFVWVQVIVELQI